MSAPRSRPSAEAAAPLAGAPRPRSAWRGFVGSFAFAWQGIVETALRQRNMRIHLVASLGVATFGATVPLGTGEQLALLLCAFLVLSAEVANSALEALVDLVTLDRHPLARIAKDAGAGAVLVLATCSVAVLGVVLVRAWPSVLALGPALGREAALALGAAVAMAALLTEWPRPRSVDVLLTVGGLALLLAPALRSRSPVFTCLGLLVFAVAVAVAVARRRLDGSR